MDKLNLSRDSLRKFGITMGVAFSVIAFLILIRHKHGSELAFSLSALFFVLGLIAPALLRPVYIAWMRFAFILGWINTRLILCLMFYLIFTPIGLVMRLFRADLLDKKIDKQKDSYWLKKEKIAFSSLNYEKQF